MTGCKNVIFSFVSYRRNIKDMPFVNKLVDTELAFGVARSLSEIFNEEFEFKSLKNLSLDKCKQLEEEGLISKELIENKDISSYAISFDDLCKVYVNETDHIRIISKVSGFSLEQCFVRANKVDDLLLDKLEMAFDNNLGYLTANPKMCGTGMEIGALLFIPALTSSEKIKKIKDDLLMHEFEFINTNGEPWKEDSPFVIVKNSYTFGHKENEFAEKINKIIQKLVDLEKNEEENIFDISASTLVDKIFRSMGILLNAYRISYQEAEINLGNILWGINLKVLKSKNKFDVLSILAKIKENHLTQGKKINIKEQEKLRAKVLCETLNEFTEKGDVDV